MNLELKDQVSVTGQELIYDEGQRLEGVVAQWQSKGFGFIHFGDGRRAYVHNSACGGAHLREGQIVTAEVHEDTKNPGKWCAHNVHQVATVPVAEQGEQLREEGVVTEWSDRGFGFITFTDNRRAYVHNSACGGEHLVEGQQVSAVVIEDAKNTGKWAAINVLKVGETPPELWTEPVPSSSAPPPASPQAVSQILQALAATTGTRVEGVVTDWHERGFGFITLTDSRRAYVHNSQCAGQHLQQGERVTCVVVQDPMNPGKWAAQHVERTLAGEEVTVTDWREDSGHGFVMTDDRRRAYIHRSSFGGIGQLVVGSRLRVTLKADPRTAGKWSVEEVLAGEALLTLAEQQLTSTESFGALDTAHAAELHAEHQREVLHHQDLYRDTQPQVLPERDLVSTIVSQTQAAMAASAAAVSAVPSIPSATGVVTEWNPRGFGFVMMEDGRRAYVHNSQCGGEHLLQGEVVTAILVPDAKEPGKWAAHQVKRDLSSLSAEDGVVVDWREEGGYGFLQLEDGRRAYVHRSSFGGAGSLPVGARLRVIVGPDVRNPGKWSVAEVESCEASALGVITGTEPLDTKRQRVV